MQLWPRSECQPLESSVVTLPLAPTPSPSAAAAAPAFAPALAPAFFGLLQVEELVPVSSLVLALQRRQLRHSLGVGVWSNFFTV